MLSPSLRTRLEKTAVDNGFDIDRPRAGDWLAFASSQTPLLVWLAVDADKRLLVAISQQNIATALQKIGNGPIFCP